MKRIFAIAFAAFLPLAAKAQNLGNQLLEQAAEKNGGYAKNSVEGIIGTVINAFLGLLGVLFLAYLVYGGYSWMTAGGDEGKVKNAVAIIRSSTIGMIIVLAAYAITFFITTRLLEQTTK
jgi:hypothetical protein